MTDINKKSDYAFSWLIALPVVVAYLTVLSILLMRGDGFPFLSKSGIFYIISSPFLFIGVWEKAVTHSYAGKIYLLLALIPLFASCIAWMRRPCWKPLFITLFAAFVLFGPIAMYGLARFFH